MELDDEMKLCIRRAARPRGANPQTPTCVACDRCLYCNTVKGLPQEAQTGPHRCQHGQLCLMSNVTSGPVCAHCAKQHRRLHARCIDAED